MSEHYTSETFATRLAEIVAHPFYGAPWPRPPQNGIDQELAGGQMIEWCEVNLAFCGGPQPGILRICDCDGHVSVATWKRLTASYRGYYLRNAKYVDRCPIEMV
jgi:hypothetical protein